MKKIALIILSLLVTNAFSQDWPLRKMVSDQKAKKTVFVKMPAFSFSASKPLAGRGVYQQLQLDAAFSRQILTQRPEALSLTVPLSATESITCELVKASLGNIKFTENNSKVIPKVRIPVTYRGIVSSEQQKNLVILTVNDDYISLIATFSDKAIQITKADENNPLTYRLYNSTGLQFPVVNLDCGTIADGTSSKSANGIELNGTYNRTDAVQDKCVNVFVDCFDSLYHWQDSSRQKTINYVYELFNLVTTGFLQDSINVQIIGINVWTTPDPFRQPNSDTALQDLADYYKDNFWGNICVGLDYSTPIPGLPGRGGKAGGFGVAKALTPDSCPAYAGSTNEFCYCDQNLNGNFQNFPTGPNVMQGQLEVVIHEMGHILGSRHTHWCGWKLTPTTTGAIDNCAPMEGACTAGPPPPATGGTIMSYCHLNAASSFINYNNGFGLLPGNTIRNFVNNTPCIPPCTACLVGKVDVKNIDEPSSLLQPLANIIGLTRAPFSSQAFKQTGYPANEKEITALSKNTFQSLQKPDETSIHRFMHTSTK